MQTQVDEFDCNQEKNMSANVLLLSVQTLKDRTAIHSNIDEKLLFPEIKMAQDMYIHPILGTALYNKIINDIDTTGTTTGNYLTLLNGYVLDALLYYVLAELPVSLPYQFWNKGVIRKQGDDTDLPDLSDLVTIGDRYRKKAEWYGERLTRYLQQNATSSFLPEYLQPGDGIDTIPPEQKAYTMPIYLETERSLDKNNCCGETS